MKKSSLAILLATLGLGGATHAQQDPNVPQYVPGEVLVKFKETAQDAELGDAVNRGGLGLRKQIRERAGLALMSTRLHTEAALQALENHPAVEYVQPNWIYTHQSPNDPYYTAGNLWGVYGDDAGVAYGPGGTSSIYGSQAEKAWADGFTGSQDVYVAVIDEGLQPDHPDLAANVWTNAGEVAGNGVDDDGNGYIDDVHGWNAAGDNGNIYDPAQDDHGTHVAGTIGAVGNNGLGLVGVNWNVKMIAGKFLGANGGTTADAIEAIDYVVKLKIEKNLNVVAINASWGGGGYDQALLNSIVDAARAEILFVAAAGNGDWLGRAINNDSYPHYPSSYSTTAGAGYEAVVSVTAIDSNGNKASWANYGVTSVDLGAPGVGILSTLPGSTYGSYNGTSMATPHVAGAAALIAAGTAGGSPVQSAAELRNLILAKTVATPSMNGRTVTGGRLNLGGLLAPAPEPVAVPLAPSALAATAAAKFQVSLSWNDNSDNEEQFLVEISTNGSSFSTLGTVPANSTSATVSGLSRNRTYWFRVASANAGGQSGYSNIASAKTAK